MELMSRHNFNIYEDVVTFFISIEVTRVNNLNV
jgi:hypothetical protein